tara:strand:+ start:313 stop:489 length:177 start_codon:yes stop_codon:yes gene_type:complete
MKSSKQVALECAVELASNRLDLIRMRDLEERDGVEEAELKLTIDVLNEMLTKPKKTNE